MQYSSAYCVQEGENGGIEDPISSERAMMELDDLMQGFNPTEDEVDRTLLYMLTGRLKEGSVILDWVKKEGESDTVGDGGDRN